MNTDLSRTQRRREYLIYALLALTTAGLYWPVSGFEFLYFDDPVYVTSNPHVFGGFSAANEGWAFRTFYAANWHPLTWLSHMLDCQVFGYNAGLHHLTNLFFHVCNTLLFYGLFLKLTGASLRSALVAALFAWHPLHVESVAWVAERKDVLSTFFFVLTLIAYAAYARRQKEEVIGVQYSVFRNKWVYYGMALGLFALGLMCKPMLVTLPFVLLLMDFWPLGRVQIPSSTALPSESPRAKSRGPNSSSCGLRTVLIEKVPFLILAAADAVVTVAAQKHGEAVVAANVLPLGSRVANAAIAYAVYLRKTIWPNDLAAYYPYVHFPTTAQIALALIVLGLISALAVKMIHRAPYLLFGWLWYLGMLVPVIGFIQVGGQSMADRYTYLPLIGIFVMCIWGGDGLARSLPQIAFVRNGLGAAGLAACCVLTWGQEQYWHDTIALFTRDLELYPRGNAMAHHCLGRAYYERGDDQRATREYEELLALVPDSASAQVNLGECLSRSGQSADAMTHYRQAIALNPSSPEAHKSMGACLAAGMKLNEARTYFLKAIELKPDYAEAYMRLGTAEMAQGKAREGIEHLKMAVKLFPANPEPHYYLAHALADEGNFDEAAAHYRTAIKANPTYTDAINDFAAMEKAKLSGRK